MRRYLTSREFATELKPLKAFRGTFIGDRLLESLERTGLLRPKLRLILPDPVARRAWFENHRDEVETMVEALEPDGPRWDAFRSLHEALDRQRSRFIYGDAPHPFDHPQPDHRQFLQESAAQTFTSWSERRVSVANDRHARLYDTSNVEDFYSAWQVLVAAEVADIGFHLRINMADAEVARAAREDVHNRRMPPGDLSELFAPARALNGFVRHGAALDSVVYALEEADAALALIVRGEGGGRFRLSNEQADAYAEARRAAAFRARDLYKVGLNELLGSATFLAERWADWDSEGRPLIAAAYKAHLAGAVRVLQMTEDMSFASIRDAVSVQGAGSRPTLDVIWPDWMEGQKERLRLTLLGAAAHGLSVLSEEDVAAFADFVADERQDAVFLRLSSFERHAFEGGNAPDAGMSSDLEGLAVAVEHLVRAMGGKKDQLYLMFLELWSEPEVLRHLRAHVNLARQGRPPSEWPKTKAEIEALRRVDAAGAIAADLIMAHRLRGAVHHPLAEEDQFEKERLFVGLLRAAALTHAHLRGRTAGEASGVELEQASLA